MAKNQLEKRWTVYGRHLERDAQGMARPTLRTNCSLDIKEESHNIRMGDGTKGPYGIPISTGAAVSLIKNMLDVLESNGIDFFGSSANVENKGRIHSKGDRRNFYSASVFPDQCTNKQRRI